MVSHLARYRAGDHDAVWRDLRALGLRVFDAPHLDDAVAVAHEMAVRARRNVELLVERLQAEGFVAEHNDDEGTPRAAHTPPGPEADELATWLETELAPFPLTVSAWVRYVGDVWLVGNLPAWPESVLGDPLVVELEHSAYGGGARDYVASEWTRWQEDPEPGREFQLEFAPDALHKANISGGEPYGIALPGEGVDGRVGPDLWFVDDLNEAFAAGGFPYPLHEEGYVDPPAGLRESLTRDLLRL